jgi:CheY-like chemotaxis protein
VNDLLTHTLGGLVELVWRLEEKSSCAFADRPQLELALMNLIINARDAMPDGGTITITAHDRSVAPGERIQLGAGDYVVFSVSDHGSGIPPSMMDKVTEPFFTTKDVGKGTGLGLSMVYGFASQSGGTLRLESGVGEGTRAEIWLPRATEAEPEVPVTEDSPPESAQRPLRIMLVDDHLEVRQTTAAMLEELGHWVLQLPSGSEALQLLQAEPGGFDLLVTDYAMPQLSGIDIVRLARDMRSDLPAIIVTGYADADEICSCPADVTILSKPFSLGRLSEVIGAVATD